jgi:thymidine kinase
MVVEGEQVMVGDTNSDDVVAYEVLCRRHYMRRVTAATSMTAHISPTPLPFAEPEAGRPVARTEVALPADVAP